MRSQLVDTRWDPAARRLVAWWVALRPIAVGEELTYDYAFAADVAELYNCGSHRCLGLIVDPDELDQLSPALRRHLRPPAYATFATDQRGA